VSGRDLSAELVNMVANLEAKTGQSMGAWIEITLASGKVRHNEMITFLKDEHGLTHGYANLVAHAARQKLEGGPVEGADLITAQYAAKENLRPIYDALITAVSAFGSDVELAPKKAGVSLRRSKQFALIEPTTKTRVDIGINLKEVAATDRLKAAGGMCSHKVGLTSPEEVDDELIGWMHAAYLQA
jgi:hypothetical protein